jgi:hypothetical protein
MGEFVARNLLDWIKKINKRKVCCFSLVSYVVVLVLDGHTNVKYIDFIDSLARTVEFGILYFNALPRCEENSLDAAFSKFISVM